MMGRPHKIRNTPRLIVLFLRGARLLALVLSALVVTATPNMSALTADERRSYANRGIYFIDEPCATEAAGESGAVITSLRGADNQEKIWNFFIDIGLTPQQAAGVMGNIQTESAGTWSPVVFQTQSDPWNPSTGFHNAFGIAQWDGGRRYTPPDGGVLGSLKTNHPDLVQYIDPSYDPRRNPGGLPSGVEDTLLLFELNYLYNESTSRPVTYTALGEAANEWETLKLQQTIVNATLFWHNNFEISAQSQEDVIRIRGAHAQAIFDKYSGAGTSAAGGCPNTNLSGFNAHVLAYAWPEYKGDPFTEMMPDWRTAVTTAVNNGIYAGFPAGIDCGGFVTLLVINSGWDPGYNYGGVIADGAGSTTYGQLPWLRANWQLLGEAPSIDTSTLLPGDVAISMGHTFIFVGDIPGFDSKIASSSQYTRAPMAGTESLTGQGFWWFRKK